MEKYIKVAVSERKPNKSGSYYSDNDKVYYRQSTGRFEHDNDAHCVYPNWWLEEVPDNEESLRQQNKYMKEVLNNILDFGPTGEDMKEAKRYIRVVLSGELLNKVK